MPHVLYIQVSRLTLYCKITTACSYSVDLKPDNVLFLDGTAPDSIRELLNDSPLSIDGEFELNGVNYPIIHSQPVPHQWSWDDPAMLVELYTVRLIDFGHGIHPCLSYNQP
jgi:serine/threonine-protein kinase SRPK3